MSCLYFICVFMCNAERNSLKFTALLPLFHSLLKNVIVILLKQSKGHYLHFCKTLEYLEVCG